MTDTANQKTLVIEQSLRERIKELNCLIGIADIIERSGNSIDSILQGVVNLLPVSWQYPEVACCRIVYKAKEYQSPLFQESSWWQASPIKEDEVMVGSIEVFYIKEMPESDEGPFLLEERQMLDAITKSVSKALERIHLIQELEKELISTKKQNEVLSNDIVALREVQSRLNDSLKSNVEIMLMPLIQQLKSTTDSPRDLVLLLETNLNKLLSPFLSTLSSEFPALTKSELQIIKMIKEGQSTKQIAKIRNVAESTVHRQRESIRKKMGLTHKKIGLKTYFRLVMNDMPQKPF